MPTLPPSPGDSPNPVEPIPVTLVTGFLGAGKTTLLRHLLESSSGRRFAVVENEFGDVGVDGSLLEAVCDILFELTEGCICCTVRDDLVEVFQSLAGRSDSFDHVLLEMSGMATPGPVLQVFDLPELQGVFQLDGVVTVMDAVNGMTDLDEVVTCAEQVATADLLILNKVDQTSDAALLQLESRLRSMNPLARQLRAVKAQVPVEDLFHLRGAHIGSDDRHEPPHPEAHDHSHSHGHGHGHGHGHSEGHDQPDAPDHAHPDDILSVEARIEGEVDLAALDRWLGRLVDRRDIDVLRMKGILAVPGHPRRFVFHGVRRAIEVRPDAPWATDARSTQLVFIGRGLVAEELREGLRQCRAAAAQS